MSQRPEVLQYIELVRQLVADRKRPAWTQAAEAERIEVLDLYWRTLTSAECEYIENVLAHETTLPDGTLPLVDVAVKIGDRIPPRRFGVVSPEKP